MFMEKTQSKTVRFLQYTAYSEMEWNISFLANMQSETKHFRQSWGIDSFFIYIGYLIVR